LPPLQSKIHYQFWIISAIIFPHSPILL